MATYEEQALAELQLWLDAGYTMEELEAAGGYPEAEAIGPKTTIPTETIKMIPGGYEVIKKTSDNARTGMDAGLILWESGDGGKNMAAEQIPYAEKITTGPLKQYETWGVSPAGDGFNITDVIAALGGAAGITSLITTLTGRSGGASTSLVPVSTSGTGAPTSVGQDITNLYGLGGPGIPEPPAGSYVKTWRIETEDRTGRKVYTYFWKMIDGSIVYYATSGKVGKYKPKKPIATVMPGGKMNIRDFVKLEKYVDKMSRTMAKHSKLLKLAK